MRVISYFFGAVAVFLVSIFLFFVSTVQSVQEPIIVVSPVAGEVISLDSDYVIRWRVDKTFVPESSFDVRVVGVGGETIFGGGLAINYFCASSECSYVWHASVPVGVSDNEFRIKIGGGEQQEGGRQFYAVSDSFQIDISSLLILRELGQQIDLVKNGDPSEKIDLLFIPHNISDFSILRSKINDMLYKTGTNINGGSMISLFSVEPFKSYGSEFNVAYVDKNIDEDFFGCWKPEPDPTGPSRRLPFQCDTLKIREGYKIFNPDYIIVLFNVSAGYVSTGGEIQYLNVNLESSDRIATLSRTFVHEFGHQLGLADEYTDTFSPSLSCGEATTNQCFSDYENAVQVYPNLDTLGCPKWCGSYDRMKLLQENAFCVAFQAEAECGSASGGGICTWFELPHPFFGSRCVMTSGFEDIGIECEGGSQCVFGGDHGQLAFNAGMGSIMGGGNIFTYPSRVHLETFLQCFRNKDASSGECSNFISQFRNVSSNVHFDLRKSYEKLIDILNFSTCSEDVNGDGNINILDLESVARIFGDTVGLDAQGNRPPQDINGDNVINIIDLATVARKFGQTCDDTAYAPHSPPQRVVFVPVQQLESTGASRFASVLKSIFWVIGE